MIKPLTTKKMLKPLTLDILIELKVSKSLAITLTLTFIEKTSHSEKDRLRVLSNLRVLNEYLSTMT